MNLFLCIVHLVKLGGLWDWDAVRMEHIKRKTKYIEILIVIQTRTEVSAEFRREI